MFKTFQTVCIAILGVSLSLFAAEKKPPAAVEVAKVIEGTVNPLQEFIGTAYYTKSSDLASKESGIIEKVTFQEGDLVEKGETLFALDTELLEAEIKKTQSSLRALLADLNRQEKEYARIDKLYQNRSISEQNYESVKYTYEKLQAQYSSLEASLETLFIQRANREIKAPYTGVVTTKLKDVGEWVATGSSVAKIVDTRSLEIVLNVPAKFLSYLDQDSMIIAKANGKEVSVALGSIIPQADIRTRTFPVKLEVIDPKGLIEGMSVLVSLPAIERQEALLVPRDAVIQKFNQEVIFTVKDGKANMMPVQVIGFEEGQAAVSAQGLVQGAQVVVKGNERIFPNSPVRVVGE